MMLSLPIAALAALGGLASLSPPLTLPDDAWLGSVRDLTATERRDIATFGKRPGDRPAILSALKSWEQCESRYRRDGAADARNDVARRDAHPYWGQNGGYVEVEWVPGFEATCAPPRPRRGMYLSTAEWAQRGNFRQLDQMGSEVEDGQWRTGLTDRCERTSRTYAAKYNRALARLDPGAFRQCRAVAPHERVSYRY